MTVYTPDTQTRIPVTQTVIDKGSVRVVQGDVNMPATTSSDAVTIQAAYEPATNLRSPVTATYQQPPASLLDRIAEVVTGRTRPPVYVAPPVAIPGGIRLPGGPSLDPGKAPVVTSTTGKQGYDLSVPGLKPAALPVQSSAASGQGTNWLFWALVAGGVVGGYFLLEGGKKPKTTPAATTSRRTTVRRNRRRRNRRNRRR